MKRVTIEKIGNQALKEALIEEVSSLAEEQGVRPEDVTVYEYPFAPVRIQHIVNELGKEGYVLLGTTVIEGRLYLLATKRGEGDLGLAPDYGPRAREGEVKFD